MLDDPGSKSSRKECKDLELRRNRSGAELSLAPGPTGLLRILALSMDEQDSASRRYISIITNRNLQQDVEFYANCRTFCRLPFPSVFNGYNDRFDFDKTDKTFLYMGRRPFTDLWDKVAAAVDSGRRAVQLRGTQGVGKSHLLAALACMLMASGEKVVFIPDCRFLLNSTIRTLKMSLSLAFTHSTTDIAFHRRILKSSTVEELISICDDYWALDGHPFLYFIVDELDILDDPFAATQHSRDRCREQLNSISSGHVLVTSVTANEQMDRDKAAKERRSIYTMFLHEGMSEVRILVFHIRVILINHRMR